MVYIFRLEKQGLASHILFNVIDVNECRTQEKCGPGVCTNTVGSYTCACYAGYAEENGTCVGMLGGDPKQHLIFFCKFN